MDITNDLVGPIEIHETSLNHLHIVSLHAVHTGNLDMQKLSNGNIECLRRELIISKKCFALGDYAVVIMNVEEFIKRMQIAAQAKNYQITHRLVKYYNPNIFHGTFRGADSLFWKQHKYRYQRELRFLIKSNLCGSFPLFLELGDLRDITLQIKSTELNEKKFLGGEMRLKSVAHSDK